MFVVVFYIILCLSIFALLLILDFKFGRASHLKHARRLPFFEGTGDARLYTNGSSLYEDLFQSIRDADKQVDVQFFSIETDYISDNFLTVLKEKAEQGVPVRLLVDRLAGFKMNKHIQKELTNNGVIFQFAETPGFPFLFYKMNRRNHRKITVIDGKIGYVGGFNIGRNYIGENPKFGNWRDYHLRLTGEIVQGLHDIFEDDWQISKGNKVPLPNAPGRKKERGITLFPTDGVELEDAFMELFRSAEEEILLGSPYFVPTERLMTELEKGLKLGITLHVMVPLKSDHPFVKEAGIPYLERLYRLGAHVHFYDAGFYHPKMTIIDKKIVDIGTANFDRRSLFLNKEVNTILYDPVFIQTVRDSFFKDMEDSIPFDDHWLKHRSWKTRINEKIAVLLRPLL
ncbi:cardiolipin synthetase [Halobacillus sp. BAB-2008]|nr:cardiolipin synthetase [Halobacillus sp. BAB-2008]